MQKWMGLLSKKKSSFKIVGVSFFSKLDWGSYIVTILKTAFEKVDP